jgi:hypothetical protein
MILFPVFLYDIIGLILFLFIIFVCKISVATGIMKNTLLTILTLLILGGCTPETVVDSDWPELTKEMKPWTRWWWMGSDVDSTGLTYNLEEMARAGIGGVEVTPVYGVKGREAYYRQYLSPAWMRMFAYTRSEAERLGMGVDMNTGTGWPFGGPEITLEDAATKAIFHEYMLKGGQRLKEMITVDDPQQKPCARLNRVMAYVSDGERIDLTDQVTPDGKLLWEGEPGKSYRLIALFIGKTLQQVKRAAPGGEGYVLNHFDRNAVMRYFGKFEKAFRENNVPYPNSFFNDSYEVYGADWAPGLTGVFEAQHGYRLQDYFPELLAGGITDTSVRVITDYREIIGKILKDNFTRPWTAWAHSVGSTTKNQAHGSPANLFDLYAVVDIPECESFGISDVDIPGLRKDSIRKENDGHPAILKFASSAAHVTGKPYTSSESLTWLTEHFRTSLSQCKPEIDRMFIAGVNHVYFHGSTYSPEDAPWPGWKFYASVDMSPTNSFWPDVPVFYNYITRIQSFLQTGESDNDFLLYFPLYDIWAGQQGHYFTAFAIHGLRERMPGFCGAVEEIMGYGYDLDYISDTYLRNVTVENGRLKTSGGAAYKALILPAVRYIPLETIKRIRELAEQGATVIFMENYPSDVPGLAKLEERRAVFAGVMQSFPVTASFDKSVLQAFGKGTILTGNSYKDVLPLCEVNDESFAARMGGQLIRRKHADGHQYFMTMLENNPVDDWITLGVNAQSAIFFDPMTGQKGKAALRRQNDRTQVYLQLNPGESILLKTYTCANVQAAPWPYYEPTGNDRSLADGWFLDFPQSIPDISQSFTLDSLGSWTELPDEDLRRNMGTGRYRTVFNLEKRPGCDYLLSLGDVRESARIKVNGYNAGTLISVPFETCIGPFLQDGGNILEIEVSNLPANRISDYDRSGVNWRIFHEINFVSITYQPDGFDAWGTVPSGLLGPVTIKEIRPFKP